METSGVTGNRVLQRLRKVTATRQLKANHSPTVKEYRIQRIQGNIQESNKEELGQNRK